MTSGTSAETSDQTEQRKIIASEFVSLDGVMEAPDEWHHPYLNDEMSEAVGAGMAEADAMLMGRVTYEEWAAFFPSQSGDDADHMNNNLELYTEKLPQATIHEFDDRGHQFDDDVSEVARDIRSL